MVNQHPAVEACAVVGLSSRTRERWRGAPPVDARPGTTRAPVHVYSDAGRRRICATVTQRASRDLSSHQIVSRSMDPSVYLASESTRYRVLCAEDVLTRRGRTKAPVVRDVPAQVADGPNPFWRWDITSPPPWYVGAFCTGISSSTWGVAGASPCTYTTPSARIFARQSGA